METRLLEDALALIEEGSMSAAAVRRNMTQPAFSRRIRSLENWLGEELVVRHTNRVEIKANLLEKEQEIRSLLTTLGRFREGSTQTAKDFLIASQHSLSVSVVPEICQRLTTHPGIEKVRLRTRNQDENIMLFLKHDVDMLLSYVPAGSARIPFNETILQKIWRHDTLVPMVGGELRYALNDQMEPEQAMDMIRYPDDSEFGRIIASGLSTAPKRLTGRVRIVTAYALSVVEMIKRGNGVGWIPHSLVRDELRRGDIVPLSRDYGRIPIDVVISTHKSNLRASNALSELIS